MTFVTALFNGLAALPGLISALEAFAAAVTSWYIQRQTTATLSQITDSTALLSAASTDQERFTAIAALQKSLSNTRFISG